MQAKQSVSCRHAYVILAHNEPEILETLVRMLDDPRNDIFIHVDAKADMRQFSRIGARKSKIVWTPRVKTYWGGPSQIKAEMAALKCAREHDQYARFHLISGVDLPIKTQDYIHDFFDNQNPDKEFVGFASKVRLEDYTHYIVLDDYTRHANPILRKMCSAIRRCVIFLQRLIRFERNPSFEIKKGTNWVSLTCRMVDCLLSDKCASIYNFLQHSHCADEKLMQTVIWNSPYRDKIFNVTDEMRGCMRDIDWTRGAPYVWKKEDVPDLLRSEYLFARKFSSKDMDAVLGVEMAIAKQNAEDDDLKR